MAKTDAASTDDALGSRKVAKRSMDGITKLLLTSAGMLSLLGFGILGSIWIRSGVSDPYEILRIASQEYVAGRAVVAGDLAMKVQLEPIAEPTEDKPQPVGPLASEEILAAQAKAEAAARAERARWIRLREFLVGAGLVARANEEDELRAARELQHTAVPHLKASRDSGFPEGRVTEGNRILGETLYKLGRYNEAIEPLQTSIDRDPTLKRRLTPMLAQSYLKQPTIDSQRALTTIESFLSDPTLQPQQRWEGELVLIRAMIAAKRWSEAISMVDRAASVHPRTTGNPGQDEHRKFLDHLALLRSIAEVEREIDRNSGSEQPLPKLSHAIRRLGDLQRGAVDPRVAIQANLWAGRAYLAQGMYDDALALFTTVRQEQPFGPESVVGGIEEIELLADKGRGIELVQTTRFLMREIGDRHGFPSGELSFAEFRTRVSNALEQLRRRGGDGFKHAIDTARSLPPVFELSESLIQEAISYVQWAEATLGERTDSGDRVALRGKKLAWSRFRAAGDAYAQAAQRLFDTDDFLDSQWSAIDAYQRGHHFSRSLGLLETYLRYEKRRRLPRGLVAYGRALLSVGDTHEAIKSLTRSIVEFPHDPLVYDARLLAALGHAENGQLEDAKRLLNANLQDRNLTPKSKAWRESLFTLAELLYQRGYQNHLAAEGAEEAERKRLLRENEPILEEAIRHLDAAVTRYFPQVPRAEMAAYLSARAHVLASRWPRLESESNDILEAARRQLRARSDQRLKLALDGFVFLRQHLDQREEEQRLADREQRMLRNCLIAEADVLREMGGEDRLQEAAAAYQTVELRYINEPPALEALLGRARCLRELERPDEADLLIRQASLVLSRIPPEWDGRFEESTRYRREEWKQLLDWMTTTNTPGA